MMKCIAQNCIVHAVHLKTGRRSGGMGEAKERERDREAGGTRI